MHTPILYTLYKDNISAQKSLILKTLGNIDDIFTNLALDADPKTAARTIRNIPAHDLWIDCNKKADSPKTAFTLFYGCLKELQELLCTVLPGYIVEYLMPSYIRNTEPAQVESTAKGVDHKRLLQLEETTDKQEQEER